MAIIYSYICAVVANTICNLRSFFMWWTPPQSRVEREREREREREGGRKGGREGGREGREGGREGGRERERERERGRGHVIVTMCLSVWLILTHNLVRTGSDPHIISMGISNTWKYNVHSTLAKEYNRRKVIPTHTHLDPW